MTRRPTPPPSGAGRLGRARFFGVAVVFLWFFIGGIAHFAATEAEMRMVPPAFPWPREAVLLSGVLELVGAFALLWRPTRRAAGIGLFLLTIAVTPAHFYMLHRPELFPAIPLWALWLRLPVQAGLLWLIYWSTISKRQPRRCTAAS